MPPPPKHSGSAARGGPPLRPPRLHATGQKTLSASFHSPRPRALSWSWSSATKARPSFALVVRRLHRSGLSCLAQLLSIRLLLRQSAGQLSRQSDDIRGRESELRESYETGRDLRLRLGTGGRTSSAPSGSAKVRVLVCGSFARFPKITQASRQKRISAPR